MFVGREEEEESAAEVGGHIVPKSPLGGLNEFGIEDGYGCGAKFDCFGGLAFGVDFGVRFAVGLPGFVVCGKWLVAVAAAVGGFFDGIEPVGYFGLGDTPLFQGVDDSDIGWLGVIFFAFDALDVFECFFEFCFCGFGEVACGFEQGFAFVFFAEGFDCLVAPIFGFDFEHEGGHCGLLAAALLQFGGDVGHFVWLFSGFLLLFWSEVGMFRRKPKVREPHLDSLTLPLFFIYPLDFPLFFDVFGVF